MNVLQLGKEDDVIRHRARALNSKSQGKLFVRMSRTWVNAGIVTNSSIVS